MKNSFFTTIRDIFLFGALILLIREAFDRTKSFVSEHKKSLVHELDQNFIDQLYTTQRHLHTLEQQELKQKDVLLVAELKNKLALIEEKYKKNSPALALLGPIGATAIVTKEAQLEERLSKLVNRISALLHEINQTIEPFTSKQILSEAIESNKAALKKLVA